VISRAVDDNGGVGAFFDPLADGLKMAFEGGGVRARQNERFGDAARRTGGAEDIGPVVTPVAGAARAGSFARPYPCERSLLADPGFVLEPDLKRLAARRLRQSFVYMAAEVFLNASCAASSDFGWRGRACSRT